MQKTFQTIRKNLTRSAKQVAIFLILCPFIVRAAATPNPNLEPVSLANPIKVTSIQELLVALLNIIMILMVPVIVFFIIYSGFKYVTARGNASQVEEATQSLTYAIIGGVLILGAIAISTIIQNLVGSFTTP
jgi:heme/copper-type cytochrome/quinol oxidase subunit 2